MQSTPLWRFGPFEADAAEHQLRRDGEVVAVTRKSFALLATLLSRPGKLFTKAELFEIVWAGTVVIHPKAKTGAHHHGAVESVIYVVSGRARMKWGDRLEFTAEAGPGDFIYVPPFVPHQEINASDVEPLSCVLCRSGQEPVVVNLDLPNVEANPEEVHWVDNIHPAPEPKS